MADYDIASVLQSCQINAAHHKRGCRELLRILEASDSFTPRFLGHLYRILIVSQNAPAVERLVGFVTNFVVFLGESPQEHVSANGSECAAAVLSYLMGCCDKESKQHTQSQTDSQASESFRLPKLEDVLMERLEDKVPTIRIEASKGVLALLRHTKENLELLQAIGEALASDPDQKVREYILSQLPVEARTVEHVIRRTRDVSERVRALAYKRMATLDPGILRLEHRLSLLSEGLRDREPQVAKECLAMASGWIDQHHGKILDFLGTLDVESAEEVTEDLLRGLFRNDLVKFDMDFIKKTDISPEVVLLWRVYCEWVADERPKRADFIFENTLLELMEFGVFIKHYILTDQEFILRQLLRLCALQDFSDEVGKRAIWDLMIEHLMFTTSPSTIKYMMRLLRLSASNNNTFIRSIIEVISDIREPLEGPFRPEDWPRCLALAQELLQNTTERSSNPLVASLEHSIILPGIQSTDLEIRSSAFRCLGLFCLHDKALARRLVLLFLGALENDAPQVKLISMKALFDLLCVFGPSSLMNKRRANTNTGVDENSPGLPLLDTLIGFIHDENSELRTASAEGLCKLLFNHIVSVADRATILRELSVELFNPLADRYTRARSLIGVFLKAYAADPANRSLLEEVALSSFLDIIKARPNSAMSQVDLIHVGHYFIDLMDPSKNIRNTELSRRLHNRLGMAMLEQILRHPAGKTGARLPEILPLLHWEPADAQQVLQLRVMVEKAIRCVKDKAALVALRKVNQTLQEISGPLSNAQVEAISAAGDSMQSNEAIPNNNSKRVKHTDSETVPSTARSKKRERPSSKKSTDTEEEYFAIKRAEFDELDNFELASQSPPATPAPSKRHKPNEDKSSKRRVSFSPSVRTLDVQKELKKKNLENMLEEMKNRVGSGEGVDPTSLLAMFEKLRAELISPEPSTQTPRVSNGDENEDDEDVDLFVDNSPRSAPPKLHEQQPKQPVLFAKPSVPLKSAIKKPKPERGAPKLPKVKSVAASALTAQFLAVGSPAKKQPAPAEQRVVFSIEDDDITSSQKEAFEIDLLDMPTAGPKLFDQSEPVNTDMINPLRRTTRAGEAGPASELDLVDVLGKDSLGKPVKHKKEPATKKRKRATSAEAAEATVDALVAPPDEKKLKRTDSGSSLSRLTKPKKSKRSILYDRQPESSESSNEDSDKEPEGVRSTLAHTRLTRRKSLPADAQTTSPNSTLNQEPARKSKKPRHPVVAFTGFSERDKRYNMEFKKRLETAALKLGVKLSAGDNDSSISHVIAPPNTRTLKTLVASIGGRWLLLPEWLERSEEMGSLAPESDFGFRVTQRHFEGKYVFLSDKFKKNKTFNMDHFELLVAKLGKGSFANSAFGADYILVSPEERGEYSEIARARNAKCLVWAEFFEMIQPTFAPDL